MVDFVSNQNLFPGSAFSPFPHLGSVGKVVSDLSGKGMNGTCEGSSSQSNHVLDVPSAKSIPLVVRIECVMENEDTH